MPNDKKRAEEEAAELPEEESKTEATQERMQARLLSGLDRASVEARGRNFARTLHAVAEDSIIDGTFKEKEFIEEVQELLEERMNSTTRSPETPEEKELATAWEEAREKIRTQIGNLAKDAARAHKEGLLQFPSEEERSLQFSRSFSRACKKFLQAVITIMKVVFSAALLSAPALLYHHMYQSLPGEMGPSAAQGAAFWLQ